MLAFPLTLRFKLLALSAHIRVLDANGEPLLFLKQKKFRLKEDVDVWRDEARTRRACRLQADRVLDFSATYRITGEKDEPLGAVRRKGARSIWRATYEVLDTTGVVVGEIHEEDPWKKVMDAILGGIPFVNMLINPAYRVSWRGAEVLRVRKQPAFFEGKFQVDPLAPLPEEAEALLLPSVLMMVMLERQRG